MTAVRNDDWTGLLPEALEVAGRPRYLGDYKVVGALLRTYANGILSVKAKDRASNKEQKITITASSGLSKDEVEKMKKDAELHAADDKKKRELIESRNVADSMVYTTEKMLKENEAKISAEDKKAVEEKVADLKKVKDGDDAAAIKAAGDALGQIAQQVGAKLYQAQQPPPGAEQPKAEDAKKDEAPIEGEFTEKKE